MHRMAPSSGPPSAAMCAFPLPLVSRATRSKFDKNIEYRNALYGGSSLEKGGTSEMTKRFLAVTLPSMLTMFALIVLLCCCTRPDSIICRICEVRVSEKPGGGSAQRRSARSQGQQREVRVCQRGAR